MSSVDPFCERQTGLHRFIAFDFDTAPLYLVPAGPRLTPCLATMMQFTHNILKNKKILETTGRKRKIENVQLWTCSTMHENVGLIFMLPAFAMDPQGCYGNVCPQSLTLREFSPSPFSMSRSPSPGRNMCLGGCVCYFRPARPLLSTRGQRHSVTSS